MATSVQGEVLHPWGYPLCRTSLILCGWKCWGEVILEGKALGNNTLSRTSRGRSGAGWGVLSHLVVNWTCLLLLSLVSTTLSRRSSSRGGFSSQEPVKMVQGWEDEDAGCFVKVFLSSWALPGWCFSGCLACLFWSDGRHWVWYWLTMILGEKSLRGGRPFLFAHSAILTSVSVCEMTQRKCDFFDILEIHWLFLYQPEIDVNMFTFWT